MSGMKIATAYYELVPSAAGAQGQITKQFTGIGDKASKSFGNSFSRGLKATIAPALALVGAASVGKFLKDSVGEAREAQKVGALTNNVIKQTGGIANVSARQVGKLSTAISNKTGMDDEAIQSGANLLLTFKNVRNEAGKGAKIFDRATVAAADLSAAGFGDLAGTSKHLGKALNDPLKGISALSRSGVTFTQQQKDTIKTLVEQNDILGAQKIILGEVESQVGGAAAATATLGEKSAVAWGNIQEGMGTALLPLIDDVQTAFLEKGVPAAEEFTAWFQDKGVPALRDFGDTVGPLAKSTIPALNTTLGVTRDVLKDVAPLIKGIIDSFNSLPKGIQTAIVLGGGAAILGKKAGVLGPLIPKKKPKGKSLEKEALKVAPYAPALGPQVALGVGAGVGAYLSTRAAKKNLESSLPKFAPGNRITSGPDRRTDEVKAFQEQQLKKKNLEYEKQANAMVQENERRRKANLQNTIAGYDLTKAKMGEVGTQTKSLADLMLGGKKSADELGFSMDNLGKKNPSPRVTTPGLVPAKSGMFSLLGYFEDLNGKDAKATVDVGGNWNSANSGLFSLLNNIRNLQGKKATPGVSIPGFASGTRSAPGGVSLVGERGPELVNLPRGAQVLPAGLTRKAMSGDVSPMTAGGPVTMSEASIREMAAAIVEGAYAAAENVADSNSAFNGQLGRMNR